MADPLEEKLNSLQSVYHRAARLNCIFKFELISQPPQRFEIKSVY